MLLNNIDLTGSLSVTGDASSYTAVVPTPDLDYFTIYTATINAQDISGNAIAFTYMFRTIEDNNDPAILDGYPIPGSTTASHNTNIFLTISDNESGLSLNSLHTKSHPCSL